MIKALKNLIQSKDSSQKASGKDTQVSPESEKKTVDPHASGGCCGGCGGEKV